MDPGDKKISALPAAGSLTGAELVPIVQTAITKRTTTAAIAALAAGGADTVTFTLINAGTTFPGISTINILDWDGITLETGFLTLSGAGDAVTLGVRVADENGGGVLNDGTATQNIAGVKQFVGGGFRFRLWAAGQELVWEDYTSAPHAQWRQSFNNGDSAYQVIYNDDIGNATDFRLTVNPATGDSTFDMQGAGESRYAAEGVLGDDGVDAMGNVFFRGLCVTVGTGGGGGGTVTSVGTSGSLTGGPIATAGTLSLVNDNAAPGNSFYYGTDSGGVKGFFALPAGVSIGDPIGGATGFYTLVVDGGGNLYNIAPNLAGEVLTSNGAGVLPSYQPAAPSVQASIAGAGANRVVYANGSGALTETGNFNYDDSSGLLSLTTAGAMTASVSLCGTASQLQVLGTVVSLPAVSVSTALSGFGAWCLRASDGTRTVDLATGLYSVDVIAGSVNVLGTAGNTFRWNAGAGAPTPQTLVALPLNVYGGGVITNLLGDPDAWVLVDVGGTVYKMPLYL